MKVLLVDAFDSFSHIIFQYLRIAGADVTIIRSGTMTAEQIASAPEQAVVLGPGPGHPAESGHVEIVKAALGRKPVLGVCLGHQAIGLAFGAQVAPAQRPMHGRTSTVKHDGLGLFADVPDSLRATRYHSLLVTDYELPAELEVTAFAEDDGAIMGLRHRDLPVEGVQFHPESVLTQAGGTMFANFLRGARG